jgi:hypothetical protein
VRQQPFGLVKYDLDHVQPAWLVAQIALAYPDKRIALVAKRVPDVHEQRRQLLRYLPNVAALTHKKYAVEPTRVSVATYMGLAGLDYRKLDIIIALNAIEATHQRQMECLGYASQARLYGLLDRRATASPYDRDLMRVLFGFDEVDIPAHGRSVRKVEVAWLPVKTEIMPLGPVEPIQLKRQGIWRHGLRNRLVAKLAKAARGNQPHFLLTQTGPGNGQPSVFVLVENIEHALELLKFLPDWALVTGDDVYVDDLPAGARTALLRGRDRAGGSSRTAIVTAAGSTIAALSEGDVIIRADGGCGIPGVLEQAIMASTVTKPLLLVDLTDKHHPQLRRWTRQRRKLYAEYGWPGPGVDPVEARIEHFLAQRPKERAA